MEEIPWDIASSFNYNDQWQVEKYQALDPHFNFVSIFHDKINLESLSEIFKLANKLVISMMMNNEILRNQSRFI